MKTSQIGCQGWPSRTFIRAHPKDSRMGWDVCAIWPFPMAHGRFSFGWCQRKGDGFYSHESIRIHKAHRVFSWFFHGDVAILEFQVRWASKSRTQKLDKLPEHSTRLVNFSIYKDYKVSETQEAQDASSLFFFYGELFLWAVLSVLSSKMPVRHLDLEGTGSQLHGLGQA